MSVRFLNENSPEAILREVIAERPDAFITVYLRGEEVVIAGEWRKGRIAALGMLCEALDSVGNIGRKA